MNKIHYLLIATSLLAPSGWLTASAAVSAEQQIEKSAAASPTSFVSPSQGNDGGPMFQSLLERAQSLKGYLFESTLTTFKDGRTIKEIGKVYFKRPNLLRFEVVSGGNRSGAVVVRQADGSVKAKMGSGLFGAVKLSLSPTSRMLRTANGFNVLDSDFATLIKSSLKSSAKMLATKAPTQYSSSGRAYVLETYEPDGAVSQRIAIDPEQKLPLEWSIFKDGHISSVMRLSNIQIKPDISDDYFVLEKTPETDTKSLLDDTNDKLKNISMLNLSNGCRPLDTATLEEAKSLLLSIRKNANDIKDTVKELEVAASNDQPEGTSGEGKNAAESKSSTKLQKTLLRLAGLEADFDLLDSIPKALESLQYRKGASILQNLSAKWKRSAARIDQDISEMSCTLRDDTSGLKGFFDRASDIAEASTDLEDVLNEALSGVK